MKKLAHDIKRAEDFMTNVLITNPNIHLCNYQYLI